MTGPEILALRERLGLSQAEFAARLNRVDRNLAIDQKAVSRWENGHVTPNAHTRDALRILAGPTSRPATGITNDDLAAMIRQHGVVRIVQSVTDPTRSTVDALQYGWDLHDWHVMQRLGIALFVRREGGYDVTDPGVLALRAERSELERLMRDLLGASYHHVEVRKQSDAAKRRVGQINRRLMEIDPDAIARQLVDLRNMRDDHERTDQATSGWPAEEWTRTGEHLDARVGELEARLDAISPPVNPPIEGVLCINADPSEHWTRETADPVFPLVVLYRDEAGFDRAPAPDQRLTF